MKIKINLSTIILAFLVSITGMYKEFLILFLIIIIHEMGHLLSGLIYKWNFDKIEIYPFGGCVKFNELLNRPIKEELIILISGPLLQILFFLLIFLMYRYNFLSYRNYLIFKNYHYTLLVFNLLPIYPLDGGRIFNCLLLYFLPYKLSNKLVVIISIFLSILLLFVFKNINYLFMGLVLVVESFVYLKRQGFLLNRLLLERFLYSYKFKRKKKINNQNGFYKERYHYIKRDNGYISEDKYLFNRFGG